MRRPRCPGPASFAPGRRECPGCTLTGGGAPRRTRSDIDDSWAIAVALASPELDVRLMLTASHGAPLAVGRPGSVARALSAAAADAAHPDTPSRARVLAKYLTAIDRTDVDIGIGVQQDTQSAPLYDWAADMDLRRYRGVVHADGVAALADVLRRSAVPVVILEIAPAGNIQALLDREPAMAQRARVIAMSGSLYRGYGNSSTPSAEYNVIDNVPASQAMYAARWAEPLLIAPLDTCGVAQLVGPTYRQLLAGVGRRVTVLLCAEARACTRSRPLMPPTRGAVTHVPRTQRAVAVLGERCRCAVAVEAASGVEHSLRPDGRVLGARGCGCGRCIAVRAVGGRSG